MTFKKSCLRFLTLISIKITVLTEVSVVFCPSNFALFVFLDEGSAFNE